MVTIEKSLKFKLMRYAKLRLVATTDADIFNWIYNILNNITLILEISLLQFKNSNFSN